MPRKSLRHAVIDFMQAKVDKLLMLYNLREAMDEDDSSADEELIKETEKLEEIKKIDIYFSRQDTKKTGTYLIWMTPYLIKAKKLMTRNFYLFSASPEIHSLLFLMK